MDLNPQPFRNDKNQPGTPWDNHTKTLLFQPITIAGKSITQHNRIGASPMCMYSSNNGLLNDFHVIHYGSMALKGAGLVIIEATGVEPQGRISPYDSGIWSDEHIAPLKRVADAIRAQGSVPGIQIAHAGRKASTAPPYIGRDIPWDEHKGGWPKDIRGPSDIPFNKEHFTPVPMTVQDMEVVKTKFAEAAKRALAAGIEILEIHGAHGYLLHNFLSGNSNKRSDEFGGSLENRMRFPLAVVEAVRKEWPADRPLWVRLSATDLSSEDPMGKQPDGWDIYQAIEFAKELKKIGVDVVDCSSGGNLTGVLYHAEPMYQAPFAEAIKKGADIQTAAVGMIQTGTHAETILQSKKADYVLIGREFLRDNEWVLKAGEELGVSLYWPKQYAWGLKKPASEST